MYRVWDNENKEYLRSVSNKELVMYQNGDLEIQTTDRWYDEYFENKSQTRFKVEKYFCNLDGIYYYEGDIVIVRNFLDSNIKPYKASIVWDNYRFAFQVIDIEIDYAYPLMSANTFGVNLRLVGNVNINEEDED